MSEFLPPERIEWWATSYALSRDDDRHAVTLREMAAICEAVANYDPVSRSGSWYPYCLWCDATGQFGPLKHHADCLWVRARKLRGKP